MGLRDTVATAVSKAMQTVGDLKETITYTRVVPGVYDPITDTTSDTVTNYTVSVVLVQTTEWEQEWLQADRITQKILIAANDLAVVPNIDDRVTIAGQIWQVIKIKRIPGDGLWQVFVTEP